MSGVRKYITNFFSSDLQKEDLVMSRIHATMDDFNFAPRREVGTTSLDVAFKLHGTTIMFYHFDKNFFVSLLACREKPRNWNMKYELFKFLSLSSCQEPGFPARSIVQYSALRYDRRTTLHSSQWIRTPRVIRFQCTHTYIIERIDSQN